MLLVLKDHADNKEDKMEGLDRLETEQMEVGGDMEGDCRVA